MHSLTAHSSRQITPPLLLWIGVACCLGILSACNPDKAFLGAPPSIAASCRPSRLTTADTSDGSLIYLDQSLTYDNLGQVIKIIDRGQTRDFSKIEWFFDQKLPLRIDIYRPEDTTQLLLKYLIQYSNTLGRISRLTEIKYNLTDSDTTVRNFTYTIDRKLLYCLTTKSGATQKDSLRYDAPNYTIQGAREFRTDNLGIYRFIKGSQFRYHPVTSVITQWDTTASSSQPFVGKRKWTYNNSLIGLTSYESIPAVFQGYGFQVWNDPNAFFNPPKTSRRLPFSLVITGPDGSTIREEGWENTIRFNTANCPSTYVYRIKEGSNPPSYSRHNFRYINE